MRGAFIPLDALDCDLNNDGKPDKAVSGQAYTKKFDIDFDGVLSVKDIDYVNAQMNQLQDLDTIRAGLFTGEAAQLTWPDGWTAQIRAVVPANISKFTGSKMTYGWLHGTRHPYHEAAQFYECYQYSADLAFATYKALGYGVILPATSDAGAGLSHAYNVFFIGGNWHKIENWRLIEPQDGYRYEPAISKTTPKYNTDTIYFYGDVGSVGQIATHTLHIDASGVVSFGPTTTMSYAGLLESTPDYFDPFLGAEGGDELTLDEKARTFAKLHPTHDNETWHLWCASLMYRMCVAYGSGPIPVPATAKIAGDLAGKLNPDYTKAPIGAFHYWTWGTDGHVGLDTKGGGTDVFMASAFIRESFGNAIGFQSVDRYTRDGAYPYRGWSMFYGKNGKITQEAIVTIPAVIPTPVVTPPVVAPLSIAMKWAIDQGIFDKGTSPTKPLDANFLAWSLYRAKGKI